MLLDEAGLCDESVMVELVVNLPPRDTQFKQGGGGL